MAVHRKRSLGVLASSWLAKEELLEKRYLHKIGNTTSNNPDENEGPHSLRSGLGSHASAEPFDWAESANILVFEPYAGNAIGVAPGTDRPAIREPSLVAGVHSRSKSCKAWA